MSPKYFLLFSFLFTADAFADYGAIVCGNKSQKIELRFDEISDVSIDTTHLLIYNKKVPVKKLTVQQTEYGILSLQAQLGSGPGEYTYRFENLGSSDCFGVYGSKQTGLAKIEVYNSMGMIKSANCKCDAD